MKIKHGNFQYPGDSQLFPISLDDDDGQMELQINLYIHQNKLPQTKFHESKARF